MPDPNNDSLYDEDVVIDFPGVVGQSGEDSKTAFQE